MISIYSEEHRQLTEAKEMLIQKVDQLKRALEDRNKANENLLQAHTTQENLDVRPNMQDQALSIPPPHPFQTPFQYFQPRVYTLPVSAFCQCTPLNQLSDPSVHPTVGGNFPLCHFRDFGLTCLC